jgi:hypothetical protein
MSITSSDRLRELPEMLGIRHCADTSVAVETILAGVDLAQLRIGIPVSLQRRSLLAAAEAGIASGLPETPRGIGD